MKITRWLLRSLGIMLILTNSGHAQTFLTNGLVAYYPMDGNANDASGNGRHLANLGAIPVTDRFGEVSNCYWFDGSAYLVSSNVFPVVGNASRTVSAWCYTTNGGQKTIVHWGTDGANGQDASLYIDGVPRVYVHGFNCDMAATTTNVLGSWVHVVYTYSNILSNVCIYVNGKLLPSSIISQAVPAFNTAGDLLVIGSDRAGPGFFWRGGMADVRIYSVALSSNEVAQLYDFESSRPRLRFDVDVTNTSAVIGSTAILAVSASGALPISFQWYWANSNLQTTAGAYAQTIASFVYAAVVTNGGSGYSTPPGVHFIGGGGSGAAGYATVSNGMVSAVTVTNAGFGYTNPPAVVIEPPDGLLTAQTNNVLVLNDISENNLGTYWVVASNVFGSITSGVASITLLYPPGIALQPADINVSLHGSGTLSVIPTGTPPFQYQWIFGVSNLVGATGSSLTLTNFNTNQVGAYSLVVANPYGQLTSSVAQVQMLPSLTLPFTGGVGLWGQAVNFSVGAIGSGALQYQWFFNGNAIEGATNSTLTFSSVQFTNAGLYSVVVSSTIGSITNTPYQLVVNPANVSLGLFPGVMVSGTVGYSYLIQGSTNLSDTNGWITLTNITLAEPSQIWSDYSTDTTKAQNPKKFYRVLESQ